MVNVKDQFYTAIKDICSNVSDAYPQTFANLPAVQYTEEDNSGVEYTDGQERISHLLYRVDIWHTQSTSATALAVDAAIAPLGLARKLCQDVPDPSGLKHKVMRYEGYIDNDTERVYQALNF